MTPSPLIRRALLAIAAVLLVGLAWTGVTGGVDQWPEAHSPGQVAQILAQLAYGLFALLLLATTFWGQWWVPLMRAGWAVSVALAAGLASVVWGGTSLVIGLLSGGAALLIALGIAWMLQVGARGLSRG